MPYCGWTIGETTVAGGTAVLDVYVQLGDELSFLLKCLIMFFNFS